MKPCSDLARRLLANTLGSPWFLSVMATFAIGIGVVNDTARCVRRATLLAQRLESTAMHAAAAAAIAGGPVEGGCSVVFLRRGDEPVVEVTSTAGARRVFCARRLPGASPDAFGVPAAAAEPAGVGGRVLWPGDVPVVDERALGAAVRGDLGGWFRREPGVALRYCQAGTDADDFVFAETGSRLAHRTAHDLVVVPGNLWIEPGDEPLVLDLPTDLVVAVTGNIYCGRSLHIEGPGRLLLAALVPAGAVAFEDVDANGRWSATDRVLGGGAFGGPIEGAGGVVLGLGPAGPLRCDAGVFAAGVVCIDAPIRVAGPVVAAHRFALRGDGALSATGERLYAPERERIAAFRTRGEPRAGFIRELTPAEVAAIGGEQSLYLAAPAR